MNAFFLQVAFVHGRERTNKERVKHEEGVAKGENERWNEKSMAMPIDRVGYHSIDQPRLSTI